MTMVSFLRNGAAVQSRPRLVLIATSLGVLFAQIDTSVVNLALKSIASDLHAGVSAMQWVIDSYNLVYASLLLTGGTLGDLYGRRRIFILGIVLFVAGTLTCALAPDARILIAGRAVSGLGAAFEVAMSLVLLTAAFPDRKERAHAMGVWASCNGLAFIIGPTFGGWLVDSIGWRSIFYVILPVCAAAWLLALYAVPESADPKGRRLDPPGQALAIVGLSAFAFAAIEGSRWGWTSPVILAIAAVALAGACSVRVDRGAHAGSAAAAGLPAPSGVFGGAGLRRPDDLRHVRAVVPHAALFPTVRGGTPFIAGLSCCRCRWPSLPCRSPSAI